jgi:hypothetical protein
LKKADDNGDAGSHSVSLRRLVTSRFLTRRLRVGRRMLYISVSERSMKSSPLLCNSEIWNGLIHTIYGGLLVQSYLRHGNETDSMIYTFKSSFYVLGISYLTQCPMYYEVMSA